MSYLKYLSNFINEQTSQNLNRQWERRRQQKQETEFEFEIQCANADEWFGGKATKPKFSLSNINSYVECSVTPRDLGNMLKFLKVLEVGHQEGW